MAVPTTCDNPTGLITLEGNDLTTGYAMRSRLASDPDVDASYTPVTTTKTIAGMIFPFFDIENVAAGTYVVHTYEIASGTTTGRKMTVVVACEDVGS